MRIRTIAAIFALLMATAPVVPAVPVRLKDMASLEGVRENQLLGYGIVVGLNGVSGSDLG